MGKKPRAPEAQPGKGLERSSFRVAAHSVTTRPAPTPRRGRKARRGGGQGARRFTTGALAGDYLRLCRDPLRDLQRWMDEDLRRGRAGRGAQLITRRGDDAAKDTTPAQSYLVNTQGLRGQPLHELQGRLDAHGDDGRHTHGLSARPRAGLAGYDGLQQVRADERAGVDLSRATGEAAADTSFTFGDELAAVSSIYAAKIAAVRRTLNPRDIAAAVRALRNEQAGAVRAVMQRWSAAKRAATERRQAKSASAPSAARAPVRPASGHHPS